MTDASNVLISLKMGVVWNLPERASYGSRHSFENLNEKPYNHKLIIRFHINH